MIRIRGLRKSFGTAEVLKGIDLDVAKGSVVAILGPSGSGKSTLLRSINLLERPQAGTLEVDGITIDYGTVRKRDARAIRRKTAMVFQSYNLFSHKTALENVTEGPLVVRRARREDAVSTAMRYLEKVGLSDRADYYPAQLSGGQQQRVAIARALAMSPEVILFDEPTSALDPELVKEVLAVMNDIAREGQTMIVVTHEMGFAREVATDVAFMDSGRIIESGSSAVFFRNPSTVRAQQFLRQIIPDYTYAI